MRKDDGLSCFESFDDGNAPILTSPLVTALDVWLVAHDNLLLPKGHPTSTPLSTVDD